MTKASFSIPADATSFVVQLHDGQFQGNKVCSGVGNGAGQCSGGCGTSCTSGIANSCGKDVSGVCEVTVDLNSCPKPAAGFKALTVPSDPSTYDHIKAGGGLYNTNLPAVVSGYYFACGEIASFLIPITTSCSVTATSTNTITLSVTPGLKFKSVVNNCGLGDKTCLNGASTTVLVSNNNGPVLSFSKIGPSSTVVFRVDFTVDCTLMSGTDLNVKVASGTSGSTPVVISDIGGTITVGQILNCNDNNPCTDDSTLGVSGARYCQNVNKQCSDSNVCTTDSCGKDGKCISTPISCDDGVDCTIDGCNAQTGCTHTLGNCCDKNACTLEYCNPTSGCVTTPLTCNDNNPCTEDSCDPNLGCIFAAKCCCDGDQCTEDRCDKTTGCVNTQIT